MTTAPTVPLRGECQSTDLELHRYCGGNVDIYAHGALPGDPPAVQQRCGCDCHGLGTSA